MYYISVKFKLYSIFQHSIRILPDFKMTEWVVLHIQKAIYI